MPPDKKRSRPAENHRATTSDDEKLPPTVSQTCTTVEVAEWAALADVALAAGTTAEGTVHGMHVIAVADVIIVEAVANGLDLADDPPTLMRCDDGRTVSFFRVGACRGDAA
jgi:hypothetical protein